jgi:hypothetical protein
MLTRHLIEPPLLQQVLHNQWAVAIQQWWRMHDRFLPRMDYLAALASIPEVVVDR